MNGLLIRARLGLLTAGIAICISACGTIEGCATVDGSKVPPPAAKTTASSDVSGPKLDIRFV